MAVDPAIALSTYVVRKYSSPPLVTIHARQCRWRFFKITGVNVASRSRGTSISTGPISVTRLAGPTVASTPRSATTSPSNTKEKYYREIHAGEQIAPGQKALH